MIEHRKSRLAWRVYAFTAVLAIAIITALTMLPKYMRSAKFYEPHAALLQHMVDRWSTRDPKGLDESLSRFAPRVRGKLTVFGADGAALRTMGAPSALAAPTADELAELTAAKWSLSQERIVVRSDDLTLVAVYTPNRTFPWAWVLSSSAVILVAVGAASMWFARRLATPLDRLANAARRFGAGDLAARAALHRDDEVGAVGRAFDDMAERTANVLASQRRLMADVSHELRTPLSRIRVALELAAEDPVAATDVLADVSADLDEIDQLIEDILTTARLDGEHQDQPHAHQARRARQARRAALQGAPSASRARDAPPGGARRQGARLRSGAAAPGARQPARQRGEVQRRPGGAARDEWRGDRPRGRRPRDRHVGGRARPGVHPVLAGRREPHPQDRRRGARAGAGEANCPRMAARSR